MLLYTVKNLIALVSHCLSPPVPPNGVEVTTIMEGSVIVYQCGEGPGRGRRLEAVCRDGNWSLDPVELTTLCDENIMDIRSTFNTSKDDGRLSSTGIIL